MKIENEKNKVAMELIGQINIVKRGKIMFHICLQIAMREKKGMRSAEKL